MIEEFRKTYPNDRCIDLISIDGYFLHKDYDAAMKCVDRVDESLGGDPYLDTLRANVCEMRGDHKEALRLCRRAIEREPSLLHAHWALVTFLLSDKDYPGVLAHLKEMDRRFSLSFDDLSEVPAYAGFVKSPQYKKWLAYLDAKKSAPAPKDAANDAPKSSGAAASPGAGVTPPGSAATTPR